MWQPSSARPGFCHLALAILSRSGDGGQLRGGRPQPSPLHFGARNVYHVAVRTVERCPHAGVWFAASARDSDKRYTLVHTSERDEL